MLARTDLTSVKHVTMGSAPLTQALIEKVKTIFPGASVTNGYGTTEAGPCVFGPHPDGLARPDVSVGYPLPTIGLRLVQGANVNADEGVLQLKTPALMPGYHNLPAKTAEVMTADGYYSTADVMRRDAQGFLYFVGRADDMFVCSGENIYPGEVEKMLERHPAMHQVPSSASRPTRKTTNTSQSKEFRSCSKDWRANSIRRTASVWASIRRIIQTMPEPVNNP